MRSITRNTLLLGLLAGTLTCLGACGEDESVATGADGTGGNAGVTQGGAQDFGLFRDILDRGEIPGPGALDELGFFAEHKIELPDADCGENLCLHGLLGSMNNMISGSNCTIMLVGLNTPIDANALDRPPLDMVLAIDVSGSMREDDRLRFVAEGLLAMLPALGEDDTVSIVTYNDRASVVLDPTTPGDPALAEAIRALDPSGGTNIYDGLRLALATLPDATQGRQRRVVLLSDGLATTGLSDNARIIRLAHEHAALGIGVTTIGVGDAFNVELMRSLSETGAGNFYFLEDPQAVLEVFTEEVNTFLVPIATDVTIEASAGAGFKLRRVHGTQFWGFDGRDAVINIPSLFVAGRVRTDDNTLGRRGGGGSIMVEMIPLADAPGTPGQVGALDLSWADPATGERKTQSVTIENAFEPADLSAEGLFDSPQVEKAFVMLNIYVGLEMAVERAAGGAMTDGLRILQALRDNVAAWLVTTSDEDIEDDLLIIDRFIEVLLAKGADNPPLTRLPDPWPVD